jgi:excisionase family DNA binding protein
MVWKCKHRNQFRNKNACLGRNRLKMRAVAELRRNLECLPRETMVPVGWVLERLPLTESNEAAPGDVEVDFTCEEVAKLLHRKPPTVRAWCAVGRFPGAWRLNGKQWRIPRAAIREFQHQQSGSSRHDGRSS